MYHMLITGNKATHCVLLQTVAMLHPVATVVSLGNGTTSRINGRVLVVAAGCGACMFWSDPIKKITKTATPATFVIAGVRDITIVTVTCKTLVVLCKMVTRPTF